MKIHNMAKTSIEAKLTLLNKYGQANSKYAEHLRREVRNRAVLALARKAKKK